jgi:hypothetical protein
MTHFWVVTQCISETARRFRGTYCVHLQGRRVSQEGNMMVPPATVDFLLDLLYDPEKAGDRFCRNVGISVN